MSPAHPEQDHPYQPQGAVQINAPSWCKDAVIYEINTRQFTAQGTFAAAAKHLPRLQTLGVDILWLMPIHPIGLKNRKGSLGSPYAVQDYRAVNPEFGTLDDLRDFVQQAHVLGMYVIIDWVANHSAWDNVLVDSHPDWYARDYKGDFRPTPWWDWSDIIDFDYSQPKLREYMTAAMCYWVQETDIDGFRCDVAGFVPNDFWSRVRYELEQIKAVFMLAEWEARDLHFDAFDMTYAWSWNETMFGITRGDLPISKLYKYYSWNEKAFPQEAMRMTFVSNHDKNAWDGTQFEQFAQGLRATIVLSVTGEGMPLIYNGQEAGNPKRLAFFERDPINWQPHAIGDLYQSLIRLKKSHTALWNGKWGATMLHVLNSAPAQIFSFVRQKQTDKVLVMLNLSASQCQVTLDETLCHGTYLDWFSQQSYSVEKNTVICLDAWGFKVLVA